MITCLLGTIGKIVRVNPDAMTAYQAGCKREEVPLGAGRLQY
jgi:hypothetical protein